MGKLNLKDFDILGIFELGDNVGIEKLVTPLSNGKFLSRSMGYYKQRTCEKCSDLREYFKELLVKCRDE